MEIASCLVMTKFLLAAWSLLSALEWFFNLHLFRTNGLLSWVVLRLRPALISAPAIRPYVHSEGIVISVLLCRIAAALALLTPYPNPVDLPCGIIILFSCFYMSRRTWFGGDGSDQMGMVIAAGVAIMSAGLILMTRMWRWPASWLLADKRRWPISLQVPQSSLHPCGAKEAH